MDLVYGLFSETKMIDNINIQHIENKMKHICSTMKSMKWRKKLNTISVSFWLIWGSGQTTPCLFITQGCLEERGGGGEKGGDTHQSTGI